MKRLNVTAALAAALMLAVSFGPAASADGRVLGEKLDSGLGTMVYGEKLDSGLGTMVYGESLDSGLGNLSPTYTASEFMAVVVTAGRTEER
jgi:hypothetical protein